MGIFLTKPAQQHRHVSFGRQKNRQQLSNSIRTTKYTLVTFFPKALVLQFTRAANYVYLFAAILQSMPIISSLSPITAIGPLVFVLIVSMIREGYEDYKRHVKDVQVNQRQARRLHQGIWQAIMWQDVKPGDIIKVLNNQTIPCDMVLLHSTQQNSICYVQTSNLDGETNLKTKYAFVQEIFLYPDQFDQLDGYLDIQKANSSLYQFNGTIKLTNHQQRELIYQNLLLRQTTIKNTVQIVGVAVYCGLQTKIMMNKGHIQHKLTRVEKRVNIIQVVLLVILVGLCVTCSVGYYWINHSVGRVNLFYIKGVGLTLEIEATLIFFTCFLLLNFLIPVSLNVLIEFTKAFLTLFLSFDKKFIDQFCDGIHVSNMSIMEQLGIIDYVLTDKTGTLTSNQMIFRSCCIQEKVYSTKRLQQKIQTLQKNSAFHNFWIALIICHDVVSDNLSQSYQGSSPDQVSFITYAKSIGYEFIKRTRNYIQLNVRGEKIVYQLLHVFGFTMRKRMSVVVKAITEGGEILMFTKGADSAIFQKSVPYKYQNSFQQHIDQYAKQGLRTLVFSYRKLKKDELQEILSTQKQIKFQKFTKAKSPTQILEMQSQLVQKFQSSLNILGATAIQDRLQDKVPETIARLQQAGITVMMITGDKLETAQNIGYLANLIKKDFKIFHLRSSTVSLFQSIQVLLQQMQFNPSQRIGLLIQGLSIRQVIQPVNAYHLSLSTKLLKTCTSVIFCRSSPQQKALIVKFVKQKLEGTVLAIGDGGNDTGMIEQANVGVGILGREGNGAAAASDFYFGQFKHLDRLLFHHGRWFYGRIAYFFVYYGWKNLLLTSMMFLYMLRSAYSGYPAFSQGFIAMYNMLLGMFIVGYYGVWAQDINDDLHPDVWLKLPNLYKNARLIDLFSYKRYATWTIMGILITVFLDYFLDISLGEPGITVCSNGFPLDYDGLYIVKSICLIIITLVVIIMDIKSFTCYTLTIALGLFTFGIVILIYAMQNTFYFGRGYQSLINFDQPKIFAVLLVVAGVTVGLKTALNIISVEFFPTEVDKILCQKDSKGELSLQNLTSALNPKHLLWNIQDKFTSSAIKNINQTQQDNKMKQQKVNKKMMKKKKKNIKNRNMRLESTQQKNVMGSQVQLQRHQKQNESISNEKKPGNIKSQIFFQ